MTPLRPSRDAIIAAARVLFEPGDVGELRIPGANNGSGTLSGYFDNFETLADEGARVSGAKSVYVGLNPVNPALLARAANRVRFVRNNEPLTKDSDVAERRWLFVDIDPVRPAGISATNAEHELALAKAH